MGSTDKAQELLQRLEHGVTELVSSEDWIRALEVASRFHTYSFANTLLIAGQRPEASRVAGFKTWQTMGRQVRKGEKGIAILAPMKRKIEDEETGEKTYRVYGFRVVHVFDVMQTDGEDLPEVDRPELLMGDAPQETMNSVVEMIRSEGYSVHVEEIPGDAKGFMDPARRTVKIQQGMSGAQTFKTTVHELAHVLLDHKAGVDERGAAEVEAESVAYVVCSSIGVGADEYSFPYVAGWSEGKVDVIRETGERIVRTARKILEAIEAGEPVREEAAA